jgi:magnesium transporter
MIKELLHSDGTITTVPARANGDGASDTPAEKVAACTRIEPGDIGKIVGTPRKGDVLWLDIEQPTEDDLTLLQEKFGFHLLAIDDIRHRNQRPKVDDYGGFVHVIIYAAEIDARGAYVAREIDLFFSGHYVVAVHHEPVPALAEAIGRWQGNTEILHAGVGALLYAVLDSIVDTYFPVLDQMEDAIEQAEERIFARTRGGPTNTENIEGLFTLRRELLLLRRVVAPARDVMSTLARHSFAQIPEQITPYMQDIFDHVIRTLDTVDTYRDLLTGAMEASLSVTSNRLNQVMKTMTAGSIILMADSLVAGIYGMNFHNIPELSWRYGYGYALLLMVVITGVLAYLFRRAWWL